MASRLSCWLHLISPGWVALSMAIAFLIFTALVLPRQSAQTEEYAGGAGSPDMSFLYSPGDLYRMAETYGPAGRRAYVRARFTFDLVWPLCYTAFLATSLSWVFTRGFPEGSIWQRANLVPLLGALFDYGENICAAIVVGRYPARTMVIDLLTPAFTVAKWAFLVASFALLCIGSVAAVWAGTRARASRG